VSVVFAFVWVNWSVGFKYNVTLCENIFITGGVLSYDGVCVALGSEISIIDSLVT
jgi:hypothetical protein